MEAQRRRAESQANFFRTLLDYQRAITQVHSRKGSLLEYNNVYLQEGPWPAKAKFDAHRLARQRDAGHYINYGFTRPSVVSQGAIRQIGTMDSDASGGTNGQLESTASPVTPEGQQAPEDKSAPRSEGVEPDKTTEELPDPFAHRGSRRAPSLAGRAFEWGALGLASGDVEPEDEAMGEGAGVISARQTSGDVEGASSTAERKPSLRAGATSHSKTNPRGGSLQGVNHIQWKPAAKDESSVEGASTVAEFRSALSR